MFKWGLSFFLFCSIAHSRVQFSFESLFTTESSQVLDTSINPSNLVFKLPTEENDADLRAELKWSENSFLTVAVLSSHERLFDYLPSMLETWMINSPKNIEILIDDLIQFQEIGRAHV